GQYRRQQGSRRQRVEDDDFAERRTQCFVRELRGNERGERQDGRDRGSQPTQSIEPALIFQEDGQQTAPQDVAVRVENDLRPPRGDRWVQTTDALHRDEQDEEYQRPPQARRRPPRPQPERQYRPDQVVLLLNPERPRMAEWRWPAACDHVK